MSDTHENDREPTPAPSESMEGVGTIEAAERPELATAPSEVAGDVLTAPESAAVAIPPLVELVEPVTHENPNEAPSAPMESQAGATLIEAEAPPVAAAPAESSSPPPAPAPVMPAPPPAVRALPRRPRLRASFFYDAGDALNVELTLMDERRELIHRMQLQPDPGSVFARIFEALVQVTVQAATTAGVFGKRRE